MLKQGVCPYLVCGFGYMNPVALKNYGITFEELGMGIEKTGTGLICYRLDVGVETGNSVVREVGKVHREKAVYKNLRERVVFPKLNDNFLYRMNKFEIISEQVVGAYSHHNNINYICLVFNIWNHIQEVARSCAGQAKVLNFV